jgi:hypothetical protein
MMISQVGMGGIQWKRAGAATAPPAATPALHPASDLGSIRRDRSPAMMRTIIVIVLATGLLQAADPLPELFTLRDGRALVGTYDARTGVLTLVGPIRGAVPVKPEDIVSRAAAPPEALAAPKPRAKPKELTPEEKEAGAKADAKSDALEAERAGLARDEADVRLLDGRIERTKKKIRDFRAQFKLRAKGEGLYYEDDPPESRFLDEQVVTLPRTGEGNVAVRGLISEYKGLVDKQAALKLKVYGHQVEIAKLEGKEPPPPPAKPMP